MPIVSIPCGSVNPEEYTSIVQRLLPEDVPCIYCPHLYTYAHTYYLRRPFDLEGVRHEIWIQRRQCPSCKRTFALLPSLVAPFQRYTIVIQDLLASLLAGTISLETALSKLAELGVSLSVSSARVWFARIREQIPQVLALFSRIVQSKRPDAPLPPLRSFVRDAVVCAYYDRLALLDGVQNSGLWNLTRQVVCLFAPSLSVNRVSYGLSPAIPP